jgi:AraC-like DNA-binding protein
LGTAIRRFKTPNALWFAMKKVGLTPAAVLGHARLPMGLYDGETNIVTTAEYFAIWRSVAELSTNPAVGIELVRQVDPRLLPPANLAAPSARTFREGITCMAKHKHLCTPEEMLFRESRDEITIEFVWPEDAGPVPSVITDASFAAIVELGRSGTERPIQPLRVQLRRATRLRELEDYYHSPVKLGARRDLLVFSRAVIDEPFLAHNRELFEMLQPGLERALAERKSQGSTAEHVVWVVKRILAGSRPDVTLVARELGVSDRTLQRRILEEGTSFRLLVQRARRELAHAYLGDTSNELTEVAFLLGYEDANSFLRAFRSWEGLTPTQWRQRNRESTGSARA